MGTYQEQRKLQKDICIQVWGIITALNIIKHEKLLFLFLNVSYIILHMYIFITSILSISCIALHIYGKGASPENQKNTILPQC